MRATRSATYLMLTLAVLMQIMGCSAKSRSNVQAIEFWCYSPGGSKDKTGEVWRQTAETFEKDHPGVDVTTVTDISHEHYMSMLGTRFIAKRVPDVMLMDDVDIRELAEEGMLMPLDSFIRDSHEFQEGKLPPSMMKDSMVGGECYSIPLAGSFVQLTYRTDLFERAHLSPPRTWDELIDVCGKLRDRLGMKSPFAMEPAASFWLINFVWQNEGDVLSKDYRQVEFDTPEVAGATHFVHDLIYKYGFIDRSLVSGARAQDLWASGKAAMMLDGAWMIGRYDTLYPQLAGKWEVAPLPAGRQKASFYGGAHIVMSRWTKHPELAWQFIMHATSAEIEMISVDLQGTPPANLELFDLPEFGKRHPHTVRMKDAVLNGRNNPTVPFFSKIWYEIFASEALDPIMKNSNPDIEAVLRRADGNAQKVVDRYWETRSAIAKGEN